MIENIATVVAWIAFVLWKVLVLISLPLIVLFAHQGYPSAFRKVTGREWVSDPSKIVLRQAVLRLLFWLSIIALTKVWLDAVDKRVWEIFSTFVRWLDPITTG